MELRVATTSTSRSPSAKTITRPSTAASTGMRSSRTYAAALAAALSLTALNNAAAQRRGAPRVESEWALDIRYLKFVEAVALSPDDGAIAITVEDRRRKLTPSGRRQTPTGVPTYYE